MNLENFDDAAQLAQGLKFAFRRGKNWEGLPPEAKEALELMATHQARILSGKPIGPTDWDVIAALAGEMAKARPQNPRQGELAAARIRAFQEPNSGDA
jgi:hypothetical protein